MNKQEPNKKGWEASGAAIGLALSMALFIAAGKGFARDPFHRDANQELRLTVLVYIYAPISQHDLTTAERVASKVIERAGVELAWVDCPRTQPETQLAPACTAPHLPTHIHLSIVPDLVRGPQVGDSAMGFALAAPPPDWGNLASISYLRARRQLQEVSELTLGQLLGHGIAHEIGHLLLGSNSHSRTGLMSAHWTGQELKLAAYMQLIFSQGQAAKIRADVLARMKDQESQQAVIVASR